MNFSATLEEKHPRLHAGVTGLSFETKDAVQGAR
jgi:hypothetical protein